jgi:rhodanese-related sulfurtransferase
MKKILIVSITAILFVSLWGCNKKSSLFESGDDFVAQIEKNINGVAPEQAKEIMDTASYYLLLDVREANEFHPGYIPGAVNLPRGILEFNINKEAFWESKSLYQPYKTDLLIVYCKKGKRSMLAASTLQQMGYENVMFLEGGFKAWELAYPNEYERDEVSQEAHGEAEEVGGC